MPAISTVIRATSLYPHRLVCPAFLLVAILTAPGCNDTSWSWASRQNQDGRRQNGIDLEPIPGAEAENPQPINREPNDPANVRIQDYLNRLAAADAQPKPVEKGHARPDPSDAPAGRSQRPVPPSRSERQSANGSVSLADEPLTLDVAHEPTGPSSSIELPQVVHVSVASNGMTATAGEQPRLSAANEALSAESKAQTMSAQEYLNWLREQSALAPHDTHLKWRIAMQERAMGIQFTTPNVEALPDDQRNLMNKSLAVVEHLERVSADPSRSADEALAELNTLRSELQGHSGLRVPTVQLCKRVTAFGVYEPIAESELVPFRSNRAIVYTEVENFSSVIDEEGHFVTKLGCHLELLTADGQSVWRHDESEIEDRSRRRRSDFFLAQLVTLPPTLAPGNYVLKVTVEDLQANKMNQGTRAISLGDSTVLSSR